MDTRFKKGIPPWNKGKEHFAIKGIKNPAKRSDVKEKISKALKGKKKSFEHTEKNRLAHLGFKLTEEHKKNIKLGLKKALARGGWKGGVSKSPHYRSFVEQRRNVRKQGNGGSHTLGEWETLKAQYNWTCLDCKKKEPEIKLTEDHIIPISKGGSDNIENIQPLCVSCNSKKMVKIINFRIVEL